MHGPRRAKPGPPAPPPPRLGEGLAEGGQRRGGDEREEERGRGDPARGGAGPRALETPPAAPQLEVGGRRVPAQHRDPADTLINPRMVPLGRLQGMDSSGLRWGNGGPEVSGNLCIPPRSPTRQSFLLVVRSFSLSRGPTEKNQVLGFPLVQILPAQDLGQRRPQSHSGSCLGCCSLWVQVSGNQTCQRQDLITTNG